MKKNSPSDIIVKETSCDEIKTCLMTFASLATVISGPKTIN